MSLLKEPTILHDHVQIFSLDRCRTDGELWDTSSSTSPESVPVRVFAEEQEVLTKLRRRKA
jgi:hypothetical protein